MGEGLRIEKKALDKERRRRRAMGWRLKAESYEMERRDIWTFFTFGLKSTFVTVDISDGSFHFRCPFTNAVF